MKDKALDKAFNYIDAVAEKLGVAAEHVYGIMVKQQFVEGITTITMIPLMLLIFGFVFYKLITYTSKNWDDLYADDREVFFGIMNIVVGIIFIITFIAFVVDVPGAIGRLVNPEYYAIKEILDVLK